MLPEEFKEKIKQKEESLIFNINDKVSNKNIKFSIHNNSTLWRANTLFEKEPITIEWIRSFQPNSIFFDVGGYEGEYTDRVTKFYDCWSYVFEPHPHYYEELKQRFKNNKKVPDVDILSKSIYQITNIIKKNDLIILRSTVPIGTTRKLVIPIIEKNSNLKAGKDFKISFCPERTVEGNALRELEVIPQIIGGYDNKSFIQSKNLFLNCQILYPFPLSLLLKKEKNLI